eukprot:15079908-Alexandrium_andersonii.AAC.1
MPLGRLASLGLPTVAKDEICGPRACGPGGQAGLASPGLRTAADCCPWADWRPSGCPQSPGRG